jgi:hypothetical protein
MSKRSTSMGLVIRRLYASIHFVYRLSSLRLVQLWVSSQLYLRAGCVFILRNHPFQASYNVH